ncbi:putative transcriptional regulator [Mycena capillaripes]|nr:putative transcriptional regulator [Mycena capillaripes]
MYLRAVHAESHIPTLRALVRDFPLGVLTTAISSPKFPLLQSSHIPFVLDVSDENSVTELGRLRGHLARANPQAKAMIEALQDSPTNVLQQEVLVLFTSPVQHYVTPKFYVETKPSTGKVVPTWNYAAVQAYGRATVFWDTKSDDTASFLNQQIDDLSKHAEADQMGFTGEGERPEAWSVKDAPESYTELLKKAIIGIEIEIDRLEGKFKMSQELAEGDRKGVIEGFQNLDSDVAGEVATLVRKRGDKKSIA